MKVASKYKICKRLGSSVYEKCQTQKYMLSEARSAKNRKRGRGPRQLSDYGRQLLEKQRMRFTYGVSEKQFAHYVEEAVRARSADPRALLVCHLELRLDNVVYRAGLAKTRRLARQLVSHGHVTVGGRKVTIPSYRMQVGEQFAVREGSRNKTYFEDLKNQYDIAGLPEWISFDVQKMAGEVKSNPTLENTELQSDLTEVLAFYSR